MKVGFGGAGVDATKVAEALGADALAVPEEDFQGMLLSGDIDAYVAWYDRVPQGLDPGLTLAAVLPRDLPGLASSVPICDVPDGSEVAVPSEVLELILREEIPGVDARTSPAGEPACAILPRAVLDGYPLDEDVFIGSPGTGSVAVFTRKNDDSVDAARMLNHMPSRTAAEAERAVMNLMGVPPWAPLGVRADVEGDAIRIRAVSYCYGAGGRRCDEWVPIDYVMDEVLGIAEYLANKRDSVI
jgi:porphobilinogen deaminase